jgi:hypothetical protein
LNMRQTCLMRSAMIAWDAVSRDRPKFNQMVKATKAQVRAGSKIANSDNSKGPGQVLKVGYWENLIRSV